MIAPGRLMALALMASLSGGSLRECDTVTPREPRKPDPDKISKNQAKAARRAARAKKDTK